jgi:2-polyprenyl-3-methyl-5-hydroxy-6-metoxy-1,4-benzoquinol methylase
MDTKSRFDKFFEINKKLWDQKTEIHLNSAFYDNDSFLNGKNTLDRIALQNIGDVKNKSVLHLQCHFGQDSLSMARMGAIVTAIDLSPKSIETARDMQKKLDVDANFICCNVYDVLQEVDGTYDKVFTSYGTISWLPDLSEWANIIYEKLKPGGTFHFIEFHPTLYMYDFKTAELSYPYFNDNMLPIVETETGTYADFEHNIKTDEAFWQHGLSEVLTALLDQNLLIEEFKEFDYSPYACFENMRERKTGEHIFGPFKTSFPHVFSLCCRKPS